jgi:DNA primase
MCQPGIQKSKYWFSNYIPGSKRVVLVEGIFDALSIGENAIALLGTILSDIHLYGLKEMKVKEILVWMDDDEAGRKAQKKIVDKLTDNGFEVSVVEGKAEPSECGECEEKEWARCSV